MKIGVIIQARSQSSRLPRKIYLPFKNGKNSLQCILEGASKTIVPHNVVLAMPKEDEKEIKSKISMFDPFIDDRFDLFIGRGEQNDLVDRYHSVMRNLGLDICVRLTGDCPMHIATPEMIDDMLLQYIKCRESVFMGNNLLVSRVPYPCGVDIEIFDYSMICWAKINAKTPFDLEHCVPIMYGKNSPFKIVGYENIRPQKQVSTKISDFSLDTEDDYRLIWNLMENYDKFDDLNKAIENTDIEKFDKTNFSKNFRQ